MKLIEFPTSRDDSMNRALLVASHQNEGHTIEKVGTVPAKIIIMKKMRKHALKKAYEWITQK